MEAIMNVSPLIQDPAHEHADLALLVARQRRVAHGDAGLRGADDGQAGVGAVRVGRRRRRRRGGRRRRRRRRGRPQLAAAGDDEIAVEALEELISDLAYDPAEWTDATKGQARVVSVPVFGTDGAVAMALTLYGFPKPPEGGIDIYIAHLIEAAARVDASLGARAQ